MTLFALPENEPTELGLRPRLESWNRSDHPDQVPLRAWVAHVREQIEPLPAGSDPLALRLDIGLEDRVDPLWEHDLDNYLYPIARELPDRIVSFWATKSRGTRSFVRIERTEPVHEPSDWVKFVVPDTFRRERALKESVSIATDRRRSDRASNAIESDETDRRRMRGAIAELAEAS